MTLTHESEAVLRDALQRRSSWLETGGDATVACESPPRRRLAPIMLILVASTLAGGALAFSVRGHAPASVSTSVDIESPAGSITPASTELVPEPTPAPASSVPPTTDPAQSHVFTDVDIPPREGPGDTRTPIQRFLGVPSDPALAADWENEHVQAATSECMTAKGFDYIQPAVDGSATLPPGYAEALQGGGDYAAGCEAEASNRVHALNGLPGSLEEIIAAVEALPAVIEARSASAACIKAAGYESNVNAPPDVTAFCSDDLVAVMNTANENIERAFMDSHHDYFLAFKANLPTIEDPTS